MNELFEGFTHPMPHAASAELITPMRGLVVVALAKSVDAPFTDKGSQEILLRDDKAAAEWYIQNRIGVESSIINLPPVGERSLTGWLFISLSKLDERRGVCHTLQLPVHPGAVNTKSLYTLRQTPVTWVEKATQSIQRAKPVVVIDADDVDRNQQPPFWTHAPRP